VRVYDDVLQNEMVSVLKNTLSFLPIISAESIQAAARLYLPAVGEIPSLIKV